MEKEIIENTQEAQETFDAQDTQPAYAGVVSNNVIWTQPKYNYLMIPNSIIDDRNISPETVGFFAKLMCYDYLHWHFDHRICEFWMKPIGYGNVRIRKSLNILRTLGYLEYSDEDSRKKRDHGRFAGTFYVLKSDPDVESNISCSDFENLQKNNIKYLAPDAENTKGFIRIPTDIIIDDRLTPTGLGLYIIMARLSLMEKWNFTVSGFSVLYKPSNFGEDSIRKAIKGLQHNKILTKEPTGKRYQPFIYTLKNGDPKEEPVEDVTINYCIQMGLHNDYDKATCSDKLNSPSSYEDVVSKLL